MGEVLVFGFFGTIFYLIMIWVFLNPENSMLLFWRIEYKEKPEYSTFAIKINKYIALFALIFMPLFFIDLIIDHHLLTLLLFFLMFCYFVIALFRLGRAID